MSVKDIVPFGDPILRKKAKPVDELSPKMIKLLDDMAETLYATDGRAGLAAPQVGILRRLIVMDCGDGLIELINPEIVEADGEQFGPEACLSFPGYYGHVKRADRVKVKTLDRSGRERILEGQGFLARCMQHEIDHLNGVLFVDHVQGQWLYHEETNERMDVLSVIRLTNGAS
ncbi:MULTISPECIES: peptide deformylase [unclassified Paenibacillus]|uniref:peptide deformylase n=1 Tax=unclassified Paenibacillus TaxID=185978 RepID=UPI001C10E8B8|nr:MULTISPECIES: peptide deformylase [unclassified Paenibacillus]MBU5441145.1 peptide deformylase [Paenibacillus sp. MSJ-34]CAH0120531.1 Peptide deformylase 1 [Paenibacillus sp. CECT 9249]